MKAAFYPVGGRDRASSRYRVHWITEACSDFVVGDIDDHRFNWQSCDILVFQRTVEGKYQNLARKAKKAGKLIMLDITDAYSHRHRWKKLWRGVVEMAKIAHCITTGNEDDAHMLRAVFKKRRVYVVPGSNKQSGHRRKHAKVAIPTVGWIGRENTMLKTLGAIWPALFRLSVRGLKFRVLIINDSGNTRGLSLPFNEVVGKKWELGEVYPTLAKCDVGLCPQVKEADGRYHKDWNKALSFWTCGVPCITFGITKSWENDLYKLLADWRLREKQGGKGVVRARGWLPVKIVKRWKEIFEKEMERKGG